jgi:hypothetical protein
VQLLPETRLIVDLAERFTERRIRFAEDQALPVMASLQIARRGATEHVMTIRPGGESLDYVVAYQCGFVLRLYQTPPNRRFDFTASPREAADRMMPLLQALLPPGEPAPGLRAVAERMSHWLLLTLRSLPVGLRIDQWIRDDHPALRTQQAAALARQQEENAGHIGWRSGKLRFPPQFLALDAVHALFADRLLGTTYLATPFEAVGLIEDGRRLLTLLDSIPSGPDKDCSLIECWGDALGIRDWFDWTPFRA